MSRVRSGMPPFLFFKMTIGDKSQFEGLMDEAAYKSFCDGL